MLSPMIVMNEENKGHSPILFEDILSFMSGKEYGIGGKEFMFTLFQDPLDNDYVEGLIITTQDSDIPPKRNKQTGDFSPVSIDVNVEGFAYANVFLYDKRYKVLVYEINKNGCFPRQFLDAFYYHWNRINDEEHPRFSLNFASFSRRDEYNRMMRMSYYKKICIELVNPQALAYDLLAEEDSVEQWIKATAAKAQLFNANTIRLEQSVFSRKQNPNGLSHNGVKEIVDKVLSIFGRNYIKKLEVMGYSEDVEDARRCRPVDLLVDTFNEAFRIQDIQVHADLQRQERKDGIESVYINRIRPEIMQILGN